MRASGILVFVPVVITVLASVNVAEAQASTPKLLGLPSDFVWQNRTAEWNAENGSLTLTAGKKTDWFVWPGGGYKADNSPRLLFKTAKDFMFSTKVEVRGHTTYDAGCVALYGSASLWAKLCLESQNDGRLDVVSVVTHERSDDTTSFPAHGTSIYLKTAKADGVIFFYASEDGKGWTIIRKFSLEPTEGLFAGFSAQSPDGMGATASFTDFHYLPQKVNLWELR